MTSFNELIQQGTAHAWLFIPSAVLLGALHGMEPGHSKTMMAAFIIAVRGTVWQAALLGLAAAFSHSLVIWALAALALHFGSEWNVETTEPYFQIASGVIIIALALWMLWRTRRDIKASSSHAHDDEGPHGGKLIDTGHGWVEVEVFETNVPPRFRLHFSKDKTIPAKPHAAAGVTLVTERPDGARQTFGFKPVGEFLEATNDLPEPHEFKATLVLAHGDHEHSYRFQFSEGDHHHHHAEGLDVSDGEYEDAHERAHAADIAKRFANRTVTTPQIILFGLTGGLLPCPAALTVLLVCLQLKQVTLGFTLVLCFSIGLALTLVATGTLAAWSVHHASKRIKGFGEFARKAPYFSSALLIAMGLFIAIQGWRHLH
jgi:nickel/cobalt exporter